MNFLQQFQTGQRNVHNAYLLVTCSALLLTAPLYVPALCFLIFVAYIPLFYAALVFPLTLWHGFWWGLICWAGQLLALFYGVYEHGYGKFRMLVPIMLIVYCALYSALSFYIAGWLSRTGKNNTLKGGAWVVCITIYHLVMRYAILWIMGLKTGYPLALPLLLLAEYPPFLAALPYLRSVGLLFCLLSSAMGISYYCITKNRRVLVLSACALFPFCIGWLSVQQRVFPLTHISALVVPPSRATHPWDCAQDINACITEKLMRNPDAQIIIAPESCYPFELTMHKEVIDLWSINALNKGQLLIIGAYSKQGNALYNGVYGIQKCRVIFNYVKNCRMPFTEYVPFPWSIFTYTRQLFLKNKIGFSSKESNRVVFLTDQYAVQLAVCSEFFFDAYDTRCTHPLLVLVNDSWFSCLYIRHLMYLFARYTAIERTCDIIYTSYYYARYLMHNKKDFYESILT